MTEVLLVIQNFLGSVVAALSLLAVAIKTSLYPLAKWANKGIAENQVLARSLEGEVKRIKKTFKG
jgi:membrane protein insertase Oxa1/YidC/SpoIIIJ